MRLATAKDIRRLDERAEKEFGLSRLLLMENAGLSVVLAMERVLGPMEGKRVALFCGKGGNGGDGMCAARHLISHGASVVVGLAGGRNGLKDEPLVNWKILDRMGLTPHDIQGEGDVPWARAAAGAADFVVDALVGVGARQPLEGLMAQLVRMINESGKTAVAVDAPSGLDVDSGAVSGDCIRASLTVTMGLPKRGEVLYPGTLYVGKLVVADLTFPQTLLSDQAIGADVLLPDEAAQLVPIRRPQVHKHEVGRAVIVAGSKSMTGAALLAAGGALVGGAGMVYVAAPVSAAALLHGRRPELLFKPQAETPAGGLAEAAVDELLALSGSMQAMAVGPGLGLEESTKRAVIKLLRSVRIPQVVDADALTVLAAEPAALGSAGGPRVLTPHAAEMARLLNITPEAVEADRLGTAQRAAAQFSAVVVLKGARTVVAEPGGRLFVVPVGNAGMATAGTGDVLTGLITALLAQKLTALPAALLGVYVHGRAGDLARGSKTEIALTASDVLASVPEAFLRLSSGDAQAASIEDAGGRRRSPPAS